MSTLIQHHPGRTDPSSPHWDPGHQQWPLWQPSHDPGGRSWSTVQITASAQAPLAVAEEEREVVGNLMTASYCSGLTLGSLLAYWLDSLLGPPNSNPCPTHLPTLSPPTHRSLLQLLFFSLSNIFWYKKNKMQISVFAQYRFSANLGFSWTELESNATL